ALLFLDGSQGPRWLRPPLELADLAAFSGHKLGAGGGGLLFARQEVRLQPLQYGGPQEWGRRAGREDVGGAAAVAAALEVTAQERGGRAEAARPLGERLRRALVEAGGRLPGGAPRLADLASAALPGPRGADLLVAFALA